MSNKSSDSLFRLIKSMTKAEKRYFKVFSSRHILGENNNYLLLFNAMDAQSEYNEEKLLRKLRGQALVNRFSISKNRLYNALLKSLDSFHCNSSVDAQLQRQLHSIEILYHKSLYSQSMKLLQSAVKVAQRYEKYSLLSEFYRWEKRILEKDHYEGAADENRLKKMLDKDRELIQKLSTYNELWNVKSKIFSHLYKFGKVRNEKETLELSTMLQEATELLKNQTGGIENEYLRNHIFSGYYFSTSEYELCYSYLTSNLKILSKHTYLFEKEPNVYLSVLTNAIYVGIRLGKWSEAKSNIDKLNKLPQTLQLQMNDDLELRIFSLTKSTELTLYTQSGEFEKAVELIPSIESGLEKYDEVLSSIRKAHFYFNIAVIQFGMENYKESLRWLNKLLNTIEIDRTQDIHCIAQLLNLIVHLELGNRELLPYSLRSTQRFLETRKKSYGFEKAIIHFVSEALKKRQEKSMVNLYQHLVVELEELMKDPMENTVIEYFDFLAWARSKAKGLKYRQLIAA